MIERMHLNGIAISIPKLDAITSDLMKLEDEYKRQIYEYLPKEKLDGFTQAIAHEDDDPTSADPKVEPKQEVALSADAVDFNLNSGDQLAELLFKHLGIGPSVPGQKLKYTKSQSRLATDKKQLEVLSRGEGAHPVIRLVLKYREAFKLRTTYTEKFPRIAKYDKVTNTHRIYTTFTVTRTSTGRIACVSGDTLLETSRGTFRFDNYIPLPGDMVLTHRGNLRPVIRKFYKGIDRMYRVHLESSSNSIKCTADHRFWTPNGWQRLGDLRPGDSIYVNIEKVFKEPRECKEGSRDVLGCRLSNDDGYREQVRLHLPFSYVCPQGEPGTRGIQTGEGSPVCLQQNRTQESNVWAVRGVTSQLAGGCKRPTWISNQGSQGGEILQAPDSNGRLDWDRCKSITGDSGSTSYRREPEKQQPGQLGTCNSGSPLEIAWAERHISEIVSVGEEDVWDIEVGGDSSYVTQGFISHNSKNPNLQNISFRTELGRRIREAFIPSPGKVFIGADFSQVELRILAHCSADPNMLEIYRNNGDIHAFTAMRAFGKTLEEVTSKEGKFKYRLPSKTTNFSVAYQVTNIGLQQQLAMQGLNWTEDECQDFINTWFDLYPGVRQLLELYAYRCKRYGFIWDLFGRIRLVPEVRSQHSWIRNAGLRQAGNQPIQGTSAGLTKLAMGYLEEDNERLRLRGYSVEPLLQIHDELVQEADEDIADYIAERMTWVMSHLTDLNHLDMRVPILADAQIMPDCWKKSA